MSEIKHNHDDFQQDSQDTEAVHQHEKHNHKHHHDEHNHDHHHAFGHHHHHHGSEKNLLLAFFLNLLFAIIELIGGLWTNSVAILSDALHDFGDSISLGVAWRLQKLSEKGRTPHFTYGYKRFSLLGALMISLILLIGSFFVLQASIARIINPVEDINATGMLYLAIFGLAINGFAAYRLSKGSSLSERAVMLHMLEDVLGWAAVLIVSIVMHFVNLPILDSLLSIGITIFILTNVYRNLKSTFYVLLQGTPEDLDLGGFEERLRSISGVKSVHDVHAWTLDGERHVMTVHLVLSSEDNVSPTHESNIKDSVRTLSREYGINHVTIEFDYEGYSCGMENC